MSGLRIRQAAGGKGMSYAGKEDILREIENGSKIEMCVRVF